jgi:putative SOS response-associated peptidase YedK
MCSRFTQVGVGPLLADLLGLPDPGRPARYNVAPTQEVAAVRVEAGDRRLALLRWGLLPRWADDPSLASRLINARSETAADKPAFRDALRRRRCVVPADGFFEWSGPPRDRRPWLIRRRDQAPFALAGLWERWAPPGQAPRETFTILTTVPNEVVARLHDRMPVVLPPGAFDPWLDPALEDPAALSRWWTPAPAADWEAVAVGSRVNRTDAEGPDCIAPRRDDDPGPSGGGQLTLL